MNPFLHSTVAKPLGLTEFKPRTTGSDAKSADLREPSSNVEAVCRQPEKAESRNKAAQPQPGLHRMAASVPSTNLEAGNTSSATAPTSPAAKQSCRRRTSRLPGICGVMMLAAYLLLGAPQIVQAGPVNANIATAQQLESVKGIGPKTAQNIIHERERAGPFESLQDLADRVRGIGPRKMQRMREQGLRVSEEPSTTSAER